MTIPFPSYQYCLKVLQGSNEITDLEIGKDVCQFENVTVFDLSKYPKLKTLRIGNSAFEYVNELKLVGLNNLERVTIGENSFKKYRNTPERIPNCFFYVKNCPKLKSLKIGPYSFSDYTVIEIENVDALEVIEMGELNEESWNFQSASLELKSNEEENE